FIPNPDNKPHINHIDGDRSNNSLKNLEWVTPKENVTHAYEAGLVDYSRHANPCGNCGEPTLAKDEICTDCKYDLRKKARRQRTIERVRDSVAHLDLNLLTDKQKKVVEMRLEGRS